MEHHPVADLFPMLPDDELKDLAHDIAERGLLQPIVLDAEGRILDGRNRYAACELANVEPSFETYDGDDPDGYALAVNIARRHLTKGQIAMVAARALVKITNVEAARRVNVSRASVDHARIVMDYASDLIEPVITGTKPLADAYGIAQKRKRAAESEDAKLDKLRTEAPDLAGQVTDGTLALPEALGAYDARLANARSSARNLLRDIDEAKKLGPHLGVTPLDGTLALAYRNDEKRATPSDVHDAIAALTHAIEALEDIAGHLEGDEYARPVR